MASDDDGESYISDDGSVVSVADFTASDDEWMPDDRKPEKRSASSKKLAKPLRKTGEPSRTRVSRRIAQKNGIELSPPAEDTAMPEQQQSNGDQQPLPESSSSSSDEDGGKKKTPRGKGAPKGRNNSKDDDEPIKLTSFTVEQLYRKYRPDLAPHDAAGTSRAVGPRKRKQPADTDGDSASSGDEHLVDPSELDLNSEFFRPAGEEGNRAARNPELLFDCNAGVEMTDSELEDGDADDGELRGTGTEQHDIGRKLIQQINRSSEACASLVKFAEQRAVVDKQRHKGHAAKRKDDAGDDISDLLLTGEQLDTHREPKAKALRKNGFIVVEPPPEDIAPKSVEIVLKTEQSVGVHGQRKKIDILVAIKRLMNREKRENQVYVHKVSLLCWIGHGTFVNNLLRRTSFIKMAKRHLLPSANCRPKGLTNVQYFQQLTRYFRRTVELKDDTMYYRQRHHPALEKFLLVAIVNKVAYCRRDLVLLFVLVLRALRIHSRLVLSLAVPPKQIPAGQLYKLNPQTPDELEMDRLLLRDFYRAPKRSTMFKVKEKLATMLQKEKEQQKRVVARRRRREGFTVPQLDGSDDAPKKVKLMEDSFLDVTQNRVQPVAEQGDDEDESSGLDDEVRRRRERILAAYRARADQRTSKRCGTCGRQRDGEPAERRRRTGAGVDIWIEVFCEHEDKWITIDVLSGKVYALEDIVKQATQPIMYVLAWNNDGTVKDVSPRYVSRFGSKKNKLRIDDGWLEQALRQYRGKRTKRDIIEDLKFDRLLNKRPFPEQIGEYKNHPKYAIERHLLRNEAIYPRDALTLGYIRGERIFPRDSVHTLHSREAWLRQAKTVRLFEEPYKVVKAKARYDKFTGAPITGQTMELFGVWQVQDYEPPTAENGIVPRSAYGNVDLFQPCMLPKGTVHLQLPGLNRICRRLRIDCAQAITGFEYKNSSCQAIYDGYVVCQEYRDQVIDEWYQEQVELERKMDERRRKRVYGNWRRLINGLFIRKKLKDRYNFDNF